METEPSVNRSADVLSGVHHAEFRELWNDVTVSVTTVQKFMKEIAPLAPGSGKYQSGQYWYRGQTNAEWGLESSLMRMTRNVKHEPQSALKLENAALTEFKSKAHLFVESAHLAKVKTTPCWWALMQHFGAPTRLLDWTVSPYVAAYFAAHQDGLEKDGAIWCFCHSRLGDAYRAEYGELPDFTQTETEDVTGTVKRLHQQLTEPHTKLAVAPLEFKFFSSPRMAEQQGRFTMSLAIHQDHCGMISKIRTHAKRLTIPHASKPAFLAELRRMNITACALFPGIDGLGRSIAELTSLGMAFKKSHQFTV